jgi:hypothetical protein
VPIIRIKYRTYATPGICHSIWMTGMQGIPDSHPYCVTNTRCRTDTSTSPDDGHTVARNMYRKAINTLRKIVHQVGSIYRINQQNKTKIQGSVLLNMDVEKRWVNSSESALVTAVH